MKRFPGKTPCINNCRNCGKTFIPRHKRHTYCSPRCRERLRFSLMTPEQKKKQKVQDPRYNLKYAQAHTAKHRPEINKRRRYTDTLKRLFLSDSYLKKKLRQQGFPSYTPDLIELKRIHITLKRLNHETKTKVKVKIK